MSASTSTSKKVVVCRFALLGCPVPNCGYAHSAEELSPIMCKHGNRCMFDRRRPNLPADRRPCGMFHPDEDVSADAVYKRAVEFAKPYDPKELLYKSSVCQFQCCPKKDECTYAHSVEEINIPLCPFGKFCPGYGKCRFEHNRKLTKQEYFDKRCRAQKILPEEKIKGLFVIKLPVAETVPTVAASAAKPEKSEYEEIEILEEEDEDDKIVSLSLSAVMRLYDEVYPPKAKKPEPKPVDPNAAHWSEEKIALGQTLYPLIAVKFPKYASQITGMLLDLDEDELQQLLQDEAALSQRMVEGLSLLIDKE
jgi:Poly-adenylate binding protein, unique domain